MAEGVSLNGFGAILIGLVGVLLMSKQSDKGQTGTQQFLNRATGLGILSDFLFAISGGAYRGATLQVHMPTPVSKAAVTLVMVVTLQMIAMTIWIYFREPNQLLAVWDARKTAIWVGVTSMGGRWPGSQPSACKTRLMLKHSAS